MATFYSVTILFILFLSLFLSTLFLPVDRLFYNALVLMTTLTTSPVMVALVQTASTLPVFLLGVPSGAMADIVDRRRYFAATQLWVSINALLLAALSLAGLLTAEMLLLLTFTNGIGLALRWPVFAAIVPQVVPRAQLPQALALNGIAMNLSRVIGPVAAGALLTSISPAAVFVANTVLALVAFVLVLKWRHEPRTSTLPGERFIGAMRTGINFAAQSPRLKVVLLRIFLFFLQSTALMALLPLVAAQLHGGAAGTFTVMLSCLGAGAIWAALRFPHWRERFNRDVFVRVGTLVHAAVSALIVLVPEFWVALPAIALLGAAWISVANSKYSKTKALLSAILPSLSSTWAFSRNLSALSVSCGRDTNRRVFRLSV